MQSGSNLVFLDLETSGLDAEKDEIFEIAALPVDKDLNLLHEGWSTVIYWPTSRPFPSMHERVQEMHTENGLFAEIASSGSSLLQAQNDFCRYAEQFVPYGQTPLAGSSVHFDRRFLQRQMPGVDKFFHYRLADVSSVKEFWKRWFEDGGEPPKVKAHRALSDCYESVNEAKWYKSRLLLQQDQ